MNNAGGRPAADPNDAAAAARRRRYWLQTQAITLLLLLAWFAITFGSAYYADLLNRMSFLGFPLGFYLGAQGNLICYLLIVALYARLMNRLDRRFAEHARADGEASDD